MDKQLRRILNLVRKTGDRMVVTDPEGDDVYVVMGLDQYEALIEAPRASVAAPKENWDEGWWNAPAGGLPSIGVDFEEGIDENTLRSEHDAAPVPVPVPPDSIWDAMKPANQAGETWDMTRMSDVEKADLQAQFEEYQRTKLAERQETKEIAEKVEASDKNDDEFGEEQFYLEPVE